MGNSPSSGGKKKQEDYKTISLQRSICYFDNNIAFVTRVATDDQNSPLWQSAVGSKTHMEYRKADVATRAGKFVKASDKCYTQQLKGHCFLACKEP